MKQIVIIENRYTIIRNIAILIKPTPIRHMTKIKKIPLLRLTGKICSTPNIEKKSTNYLGMFGDRKEKNCH